MKLKDYAAQQGISYRTAWRWWKLGKLPGHQMDTGTILIDTEMEHPTPSNVGRVAIYARVSSAENTATLDTQAERLVAYCAAKGYQVSRVVKEIGSGVNDARPKLLALLEDQSIGLIVVEHQDRLTQFGFRYLDTLLKSQGRAIEVVNLAENGQEDLMADLTAILYSFTARLYGQRRAKRKTETIIQALEAGESEDAHAPG
jgi:predicted site-specific integrase-resolvase